MKKFSSCVFNSEIVGNFQLKKAGIFHEVFSLDYDKVEHHKFFSN